MTNRITHKENPWLDWDQSAWCAPGVTRVIEDTDWCNTSMGDEAYMQIKHGRLHLCYQGAEFFAVLGDQASLRAALKDIATELVVVRTCPYDKHEEVSEWFQRCFVTRSVVGGSALESAAAIELGVCYLMSIADDDLERARYRGSLAIGESN